MRLKHNLFASAIAVAIAGGGLVGCGGSDSAAPPVVETPPAPSEYEMALEAIADAGTVEAAETAYEEADKTEINGEQDASLRMARDERVSELMAATEYARGKKAIMDAKTAEEADTAYAEVDKEVISASEGESLMMALNERKMAIARAERIDMQKEALMEAAGMIDTSDLSDQDKVNAARMAIADLRQALDEADDLSDDDKRMYMSALENAKMEVDGAQEGIDTEARRAEQMEALSKTTETLQTAVATLAGAQTRTNLEGAERALNDLKEALADAIDLTTAEKAEAQGVATTAEAQITGAETAVETAETEKENEGRIAAQAVRNEAAMEVAKAIMAHNATVADARPPEFQMLTTPNASPGTNFGITRGRGVAKIAVSQAAAEIDKFDDDRMAPTAGTGWHGETFQRDGTERKRMFKEMGAVYTDIEAARDLLWTALAPTGLATDDTSGVATWTAGEGNALDAEHFTGVFLPAPPAADNTGGTKELKAAGNGVAGSLYGVPGRFTVTTGTDDAVVTRTRSDKVYVSVGVTFTPDSFNALTTMAKYANPDTDYTYFGYWMKSTKHPRNDNYEHDIRTFFGGGNTSPDLALGETGSPTVLGSASYYGAAAGVYVKKDGAGDSLVVTNGNFTADAMLTARFGGGSIAVDRDYEVEGTISDFMAGSTDLGFADLTLRGLGADSGAEFSATGVISGGETDGGGTSGVWSGQFFGNAGVDTADDASDNFPTDVAGEFNGHFLNGHVAGAFGAELDY